MPSRKRHQARRLDLHFLGERAVGGEGDHAVARLASLHAFADFLHHAGHLAARGEGQRRLELVLVLDDQHVGEIQARRLHADDDFARRRPGRGQVLDDQRFRRAELLAEHGFHRVTMRMSRRRIMTEPVLHHYPVSPFAEKARAMLGFKNWPGSRCRFR